MERTRRFVSWIDALFFPLPVAALIISSTGVMPGRYLDVHVGLGLRRVGTSYSPEVGSLSDHPFHF